MNASTGMEAIMGNKALQRTFSIMLTSIIRLMIYEK